MPLHVTAAERDRRLASLCMAVGRRPWPGKRRDRAILLQAAASRIHPLVSHDERSVTRALSAWLERGVAFARTLPRK